MRREQGIYAVSLLLPSKLSQLGSLPYLGLYPEWHAWECTETDHGLCCPGLGLGAPSKVSHRIADFPMEVPFALSTAQRYFRPGVVTWMRSLFSQCVTLYIGASLMVGSYRLVNIPPMNDHKNLLGEQHCSC